VDPGAAGAGWVSAPAVEAEEQAAVAPQAGAAAPAAQEVCGRPANRARQLAVGRVAAGVVQVGLGVEVETAAGAAVPVVVAQAAAADQAEDLEVVGWVVEAVRAAAADQVEDLEVVDPVVEAEQEELVAGPVRPANLASG
jgi:hypothetical protein